MGVTPHDCETFFAIVKHWESDDRKQRYVWTNIKFVSVIIIIVALICAAILHVSPPTEGELADKGYTKRYIYIDNSEKTFKNVDNVVDYVGEMYSLTLSLYTEKELKKEISTENGIGLLGRDITDLKIIKVPIVVPISEVNVAFDKTSGKYRDV